MWHYSKYIYIKYTDYIYHFEIIKLEFKKYNINLLDKNLELDYFQRFTEFNNTQIK